MGARVRATLGDIDPLNEVPFARDICRVQKGLLLSRILLRIRSSPPMDQGKKESKNDFHQASIATPP